MTEPALLLAFRTLAPTALRRKGWSWERLARESGVDWRVLYKWRAPLATTYDGAKMERVLLALDLSIDVAVCRNSRARNRRNRGSTVS